MLRAQREDTLVQQRLQTAFDQLRTAPIASDAGHGLEQAEFFVGVLSACRRSNTLASPVTAPPVKTALR